MTRYASVPIDETEAIRTALQMDKAAFSQALGFTGNAYNGMVAKGRVTPTVALAAKALAPPPNGKTELFVVEVNGSSVHLHKMNEAKRMLLDDKVYLLIPETSPGA